MNAKITIKSKQTYENKERDSAELITIGEYKAENGVYVISYKDSEVTGFEGCTTTLTVERDKASLVRSGEKHNSNLIIEDGKKHHCVYSTPYGDLMVGVNAKKVIPALNDNGGDLYLEYTIDINSTYMSDNELFIKVEETESET